MHCPTCGYDNPLTTRFCAGCGIVLVEDAKVRAPRRLRRVRRAAAPPPALPITVCDEPAPPAETGEPSRTPAARRRLGWALAAGALVAVTAIWIGQPRHPGAVVVESRAEFVPLPVASGARVPAADFAATSVVADPLPQPRADPSRAVAAKKSPKPVVAKAEPDPPPPAAEPVPAQHAALDVARVAPSVAAPPPDRWTRVQQEIARCGERNVLERVFCVERVRHANCDGYWGQVPSCPGAQVVDYTR